ncbi:MAG: ADP-ribosylglycohydrolase family protein [Ruminococcus sp.]|nr:ADP-ribosylglycohydrolase family protein [Ruminococcus sp.]
MEKKQLTLHEKWESDIQSYKKSGGMRVTVIQCKNCKHWIKSDALHCLKYEKTNKPTETLQAKKECPCFESQDVLNIEVKNDYERRLKGGIWGAIIGDALGVPVEFSERNERKKDPVKEMRGYGTYNQPMGTWSDDTSMMLCLIETLTEGYSVDKLAKKFVRFANEGYMTPCNTVFDIGNAVMKAIRNIMSGIPPAECGGNTEYDNGNGSLMRILPLAFCLKDASSTQKINLIEEVSSVTHRHQISLLSCIIYIQFALELMMGKDKTSAYHLMTNYVTSIVRERYLGVLQNFENVLNGKIISLNENKIKSTGYVLDTIEASLWCFMNSDSYDECIFKAINLGGDTDTIACVSGGLAGIYHGIDSISNNWIQMLVRKNDINAMIDKFITTL